jgi:hypothetical protein
MVAEMEIQQHDALFIVISIIEPTAKTVKSIKPQDPAGFRCTGGNVVH